MSLLTDIYVPGTNQSFNNWIETYTKTIKSYLLHIIENGNAITLNRIL